MFNLKRDLISKINKHFLDYNITEKTTYNKYRIANNKYKAIKKENTSSLREISLIMWWDKINSFKTHNSEE